MNESTPGFLDLRGETETFHRMALLFNELRKRDGTDHGTKELESVLDGMRRAASAGRPVHEGTLQRLDRASTLFAMTRPASVGEVRHGLLLEARALLEHLGAGRRIRRS